MALLHSLMHALCQGVWHPGLTSRKLHLFVHGALSGLWPLLTSQATLWEIMPFGLSSAFGWWNTVLVSVVKILSLLTAPRPAPTPKWAQALFGHQVCRARLASEPGSLPCLGSLLLHTTHCDLTLRTSHRVLGDSSAWNAAKLVKGCSNKAPSGTTCWSRGQGDGVESVTCVGHFIWLWSPLIRSVFSSLLIPRMGRFSPELLYYAVVLIKKEPLRKESIVLEIHDTELHQTLRS